MAGRVISPGTARLAAVRRYLRALDPAGPGFDTIYTWTFTAVLAGVLLYGVAAEALGAVVTPERLAAFGAAGVLLCLTAAARWGAALGPVVFSRPDVAHLLGAPLPRRGLGLRRLAGRLAAGAAAGAALGGLLWLGVAGDDRGLAGARGAGLVAGMATAGLGAVALAHAVAVSARVQRGATTVLPLLTAAAAGAGLAGGGEWLAWSGPWGWATLPATGAAGWLAATVACAVAAVAAAGAALAGAGAGSTERHDRRAAARARIGAAAWGFDARGIGLVLRERDASPQARAARASGRRPRRPRDARLLPAWRQAVGWRARPGTPLVAAALAAAGGVAAGHAGTDPFAAALAALALYAAGSRLLEPLRDEVDRPQRALLLLGTPVPALLPLHVLAPAVLVAVTALGGAAVTLLAVGGAAGPGLLVAAGAPVAVLCAARSAMLGGRLPQEVLFTATAADPSGGGLFLTAWALRWPAAAVALLTVAGVLVTSPGGLVAAVALLGVAAAGLLALPTPEERAAAA